MATRIGKTLLLRYERGSRFAEAIDVVFVLAIDFRGPIRGNRRCDTAIPCKRPW